MQLTRSTLEKINNFMKGTTLFASGDCEIVLFKNDINPSFETLWEDIEVATFVGSAGIDLAAVAFPAVVDSDSGRYGFIVQAADPPIVWICTASPAEPETIYGVCIVEGGDTLRAARRFVTPIVISEAGNFVEISELFGFLQLDVYADDSE